MISAQYVRGFIEDEAGDQTIGDHLFEVFAPDDDKGTAGRPADGSGRALG